MHLDIEQTSDTRCFFLYKIPDFETLRISITLNQLKTLISYEHYTNISNICQKHWKKSSENSKILKKHVNTTANSELQILYNLSFYAKNARGKL